MSKKSADTHRNVVVFQVDPTECPFREFRDNELSLDFWGLGPAAFRATVIAYMNKSITKPPADHLWVDEQTQPLPRSVRQYLHGWIRAEGLAESRWNSELVVFDEHNDGKMNIAEIQLNHAKVLRRSSFCRRVLSACFMLERVDGITVEHQWENFVCSIPPEGWHAKYHIYSPGIKYGGGAQHRPVLSKNGCYLVRLFYLGAWRCVWVSDQVPVDAAGDPLLPFSLIVSHPPATKAGQKQQPVPVTPPSVLLWPLLICKALLKLAAPDLNSDEGTDSMEDELLLDFNVLHCLTGGLSLTHEIKDSEKLWEIIISEVPVFAWDDDDETVTSTLKSKSTRKQTVKEAGVSRRGGITNVLIKDTKHLPPYHLPGITPGHEMSLLITMARDLPLKKPLPEPEVAFWKYYRWVDWVRSHGLYEAFDCPRTKYLKVNGLMKLSYCPHLLDVQSTESITIAFRAEHGEKSGVAPAAKGKKDTKSVNMTPSAAVQMMKEELREWIQFETLQELVKNITIVYYPSMYEFTSVASSPPIRITKGIPNKNIDIQAPKSAPIYFQIDGPDEYKLKIALNVMHPRVLLNAGIPIVDYIEPGYLVLERFEWFVDCDLPMPKGYVRTRAYDSVEIDFLPGRHFCRLWVHSRMNWHLMLISESTLLVGTRDVIQSAAIKECPWASRFLSALGAAFNNWIRVNRSIPNIYNSDREFYRSYMPDLTWDNKVVGYDRPFLHWMFRQALQSLLVKKLPVAEFQNVCVVLRRYFCDPDFGLPVKPKPPRSFREIIASDPCDCLMPETEEVEAGEEQIEEQVGEESPIVDPSIMNQLLAPSRAPAVSQVCELATEEVPCGVLKDEREKVIKKHEAATVLQAYWRGAWARKCLNSHDTFTPDVLKSIQDAAFGSPESLSALMNEFFGMYPGAKYAYSVSSALSGVYGLQQHQGIAHITTKCKWIPYFQGVFYCHAPVKVHFDVQSTLPHSTVAVYNNDTGVQMPQCYSAHITFDLHPNVFGYSVMGHGTLSQQPLVGYDTFWQLTVLSCIDGVFHPCDNEEVCHEVLLPSASKLHLDEVFLPNRRNILGGMQIAITKHETIAFRAAATSPDLELVATLRTLSQDGVMRDVSTCHGRGEIHWPYIRLKPNTSSEFAISKKKSASHANLMTPTGRESGGSTFRSAKTPKSAKLLSAKARSITKMKIMPVEPKQYFIEVVAPAGWPLTLLQWKRVDELRNTQEVKLEITSKKNLREKPSSAKDKDKDKGKFQLVAPVRRPEPGDAYIELECSLAIGGGANAKRDDVRDLEFMAARRSWDANEPGRNLRGAQLRREFRAEFLEALPPPPSESIHTMGEEAGIEEFEGEEDKKEQQGPSPATESGMLEMTVECEEEAKYLLMPELLRDKFVPLYFLPLCMKEKNEDESAIVSPDMAEAAKKDRHARIDAALERMRELQSYNELYVLGRQKTRCQLLEKLFVDAQWPLELHDAMEERGEAILKETLLRSLSLTKKKQEAKKK